MNFEIVGEITVVETIAAGTGIRDIKRLRKNYGKDPKQPWPDGAKIVLL